MQDSSLNTDSDDYYDDDNTDGDDGEHPCRIEISGADPASIAPQLIEQAIRATLDAHNRTWATVSVALVDDAQMATLHEKFMDDPTPTDVLTFDLADDLADDLTDNLVNGLADTLADSPVDDVADAPADSNHAALDGEIVISVDTARRESQNRGHALSDEVLLYAVHGTLHLLGYDDHTEDEAQAMHRKENEILTRLGLGPVYGEVR